MTGWPRQTSVLKGRLIDHYRGLSPGRSTSGSRLMSTNPALLFRRTALRSALEAALSWERAHAPSGNLGGNDRFQGTAACIVDDDVLRR